MMIERIKALVTELSAEDWKQRERAEAQIVTLGPAAIGVLKQMSGNVPPEAQQRIDSILKQIEKKRTKPAPTGSALATPADD